MNEQVFLFDYPDNHYDKATSIYSDIADPTNQLQTKKYSV